MKINKSIQLSELKKYGYELYGATYKCKSVYDDFLGNSIKIKDDDMALKYIYNHSTLEEDQHYMIGIWLPSRIISLTKYTDENDCDLQKEEEIKNRTLLEEFVKDLLDANIIE